MSSRGGEQSCRKAPRGEEEEEVEEEEVEVEEVEDFFDCQEDLVPPGAGGNQQDGPRAGGTREEVQNHRLQEEEPVLLGESDGRRDGTEADRRPDSSAGEEEEEEEEEEEAHRLQEEQQDSDSELKAEAGPGREFDDDYLREVEKDLTEEEKESRRQESLALKEAGNRRFKAGEWAEAEQSYTEALTLCPVCFSKERSILFSNRAAARGHLDLKDSAVSDCSRALELNPEYLRALLRRAELYEQLEKLDEALEDYKKVLERDPGHAGARQACMRLPQQIQERNEKLKEEMMSKLKDLGNLFLRPFGLSTSNFQLSQDSASGSYSVNFVQNPDNNNR